MNTLTNHEEQAVQFLKDTETKYKAVYVDHKYYFSDDSHTRDVWRIYLSRRGERCSFTFGQSLKNSDYGNTEPTPYDILACLQKYPVDSFEDFCHEFGYDDDSIKAKKIHKAVKKEYEKVERLFDDVIDELAEIC